MYSKNELPQFFRPPAATVLNYKHFSSHTEHSANGAVWTIRKEFWMAKWRQLHPWCPDNQLWVGAQSSFRSITRRTLHTRLHRNRGQCTVTEKFFPVPKANQSSSSACSVWATATARTTTSVSTVWIIILWWPFLAAWATCNSMRLSAFC